MLSPRLQTILETIIEIYLNTAQPVSSGMLLEKYDLGISPATVRNEMMVLEEAGYIYQPHTSAGRVPTAMAYRFLVDGGKIVNLKKEELKMLDKAFGEDDKSLAKAIAEISGCTVYWAFHKNDLYYTGLSNLFSQPEFKQVGLVHDFSLVVDRMEDIIDDIFEKLIDGSQIMIGEENPFGNFLSAVVVKYKHHSHHSIFGILGPMRMDYRKNLALVTYLKQKYQ